jgi:hypothetical protein
MVELDDAMRRALLAREDPPMEARDAILAGLRARLRGPSDPGSDPEPGDGGVGLVAETASNAARVAWTAKVVAATAGLTASGLLTLKLGAMLIGGPSDEAPRESATGIVQAAADAPPPRPSADPIPRPGPEHHADPAPKPTPTSSTKTDASEPSDESSTLAAELALVRAAKQKRVADPEDALAQLELHRERFAKGSLAPEREALRVELLCELGRASEADAARDRFLVDFPGSPLRGRVLASCSKVGTDPRAAGD